MTNFTIPLPRLTQRYLTLKGRPSAERLAEAEQVSAHELAQEFSERAEAFSAFPGEQCFYELSPARRDGPKSQEAETRTYGWAMAIKKAGLVEVEGGPDVAFRYIDREIVPTRIRPPLPFASPGGAHLAVDLILANARSGGPIVSELKIAADKDPYRPWSTAKSPNAWTARPSASASGDEDLPNSGSQGSPTGSARVARAAFPPEQIAEVKSIALQLPGATACRSPASRVPSWIAS